MKLSVSVMFYCSQTLSIDFLKFYWKDGKIKYSDERWKEKNDSTVNWFLHKFLLRNMILNKKLVYCKFLLQFSSGLEANYKNSFLKFYTKTSLFVKWIKKCSLKNCTCGSKKLTNCILSKF